jgi:hypothetical protein
VLCHVHVLLLLLVHVPLCHVAGLACPAGLLSAVAVAAAAALVGVGLGRVE